MFEKKECNACDSLVELTNLKNKNNNLINENKELQNRIENMKKEIQNLQKNNFYNVNNGNNNNNNHKLPQSQPYATEQQIKSKMYIQRQGIHSVSVGTHVSNTNNNSKHKFYEKPVLQLNSEFGNKNINTVYTIKHDGTMKQQQQNENTTLSQQHRTPPSPASQQQYTSIRRQRTPPRLIYKPNINETRSINENKKTQQIFNNDSIQTQAFYERRKYNAVKTEIQKDDTMSMYAKRGMSETSKSKQTVEKRKPRQNTSQKWEQLSMPSMPPSTMVCTFIF